MALISKPDYTYIWASGGSVVEPSDTKKQTGWTAEVPPFQWENWIQNRQDQFIAHVNQRGIPEWDGQTEYEAGGLSYVQGTDGIVYKSVAASGPSTTVQNPTTDVSDVYWTEAFASVGAFLTEGAGDARYLVKSLNGSDIPSIPTFRSNIGVFGSVITTVAASSTIDLTAGAPDTCQLEISGTGVSINEFTVAANYWFIVKFSGSTNTLVNSTSLVTNTGANIVTNAGDTCVLRATAANKVEILSYVRSSHNKSRCTAWVNFNGTGTPVIRDSFNVNSIVDNGTGDYTANYATNMDNTNYAHHATYTNGAATPYAPEILRANVLVSSIRVAQIGSTNGAPTGTDWANCNITIHGGKL